MIYARIQDGVVAELIEIGDGTPPLQDRYHPDFVAACTVVPTGMPVAEGWRYDGTAFSAPAPVAPSAEALAAAARQARDLALERSRWLVERHREQVDGGLGTTLTAAEYAELLAWRQALRDWPASETFPATIPASPAWMDGA